MSLVSIKFVGRVLGKSFDYIRVSIVNIAPGEEEIQQFTLFVTG